VSVKNVIGSVVDMIRPQLTEKQLKLIKPEIPPDLKMTADIDKTLQILLNLLSNALKFTPADGAIEISVRDEGARVVIDVRDTGIGVPPEELDRIFEPFAQAKRSLVASEAGVGLGLAISRQLARAMNGDLTVKSEVGRGSTFTLTLPETRTAS